MSAKESSNDPASNDLFVEADDAETEMDFDDGGVPFYIAIAWVVFLAAYIVYMAVYALPDWAAWGQL